jgi:hypothetical protein
MKKLLAFIFVTTIAVAATASDVSYSTEATFTPSQTHKGLCQVVVAITQFQQNGKTTDKQVSTFPLLVPFGQKASYHLAFNNHNTKEILLDLFCPKQGDADFASCAVTIKQGSETLANSTIRLKMEQSADDKDIVLPGRHLSESQVADIAFRELPRRLHLQCEFRDGVWEVSEVKPGVWGVSSVTTNAEGRVLITSTNATRLVLKVRDADGKVEQIKTP